MDTKKNVDISVKIETPSDAALSPDGKKLAFSFRGMLFVSDNEGNFIQQIETPAQERVAEVVWGTDSKTLYYTRTNKGYYHIFKTRADVPGAETLVYESAGKARSLTPSPKGDKIAFVSGKRSLMVLDTKKDHTEKLADQEFWAHQNYSIAFSHDQRHLAFTAMNMFEQDVYISLLTQRGPQPNTFCCFRKRSCIYSRWKILVLADQQNGCQLSGRRIHVSLQSSLTEKPKTPGNGSLRTIVPKQQSRWQRLFGCH